MSVTAIKLVQNRSSFRITLQDTDRPAADQTVSVDPGQDLVVDMWIPWAPGSTDFADHHIDVVFEDKPVDKQPRSITIWQALIAGDGA